MRRITAAVVMALVERMPAVEELVLPAIPEGDGRAAARRDLAPPHR